MFLVILVNIFYALVYPVGKIALRYTTPLFLTGVRMIISGLLVLGYQYIFNRSKFTVKITGIWSLIIGAVFTIYLNNWLEFVGIHGLSPAKAAFLYNLYPFAAALVSYVYLGQALSKAKWLGLLIGFLGSLPLLLVDMQGDISTYKYLGFITIPEIAVIAAVFACSLGWIFIQRALCDNEYDSVMGNGIIMLGGGLLALVHSFFVESWNPLPITDTLAFFKWTIGLIVLSNFLCNTLFIELLKKYTLTFLSFTGFISPIITALLDWLFFGYSINWAFYVSTFIMGIGFYLFYKDELSKPVQNIG